MHVSINISTCTNNLYSLPLKNTSICASIGTICTLLHKLFAFDCFTLIKNASENFVDIYQEQNLNPIETLQRIKLQFSISLMIKQRLTFFFCECICKQVRKVDISIFLRNSNYLIIHWFPTKVIGNISVLLFQIRPCQKTFLVYYRIITKTLSVPSIVIPNM